MIRGWNVWIGAAMLSIATAAASAPSEAPVDEFWSLNASFPQSLSVEGRMLKTTDPEQAIAGLRVWMEEHQAAPTSRPVHSELGHDRASWIVRAADKREMDDMLKQYGHVTRRNERFSDDARPIPDRDAETPVVLQLIGGKKVAARRDALQKEIDALGETAQKLPNIVLLASSFAYSLDRLAQAREQYDASFVADIEVANQDAPADQLVPGRHGLINLSVVNTPLKLLPDAYAWDPGAVRVPGVSEPQGDYLTWIPVTSSLDDLATLRISVATDNPEEAFGRLDADLRAIGAQRVALVPLPSSTGRRNVFIDHDLYPASPLTGYLIQKSDMERVRAVATKIGRLAAWNPRRPVWKDAFREVPSWFNALTRESQAGKAQLAASPNIRSLLAHQLEKMGVFAELFGRYQKSELVALEVLGKPIPQQPPVPYVPMVAPQPVTRQVSDSKSAKTP